MSAFALDLPALHLVAHHLAAQPRRPELAISRDINCERRKRTVEGFDGVSVTSTGPATFFLGGIVGAHEVMKLLDLRYLGDCIEAVA